MLYPRMDGEGIGFVNQQFTFNTCKWWRRCC